MKYKRLHWNTRGDPSRTIRQEWIGSKWRKCYPIESHSDRLDRIKRWYEGKLTFFVTEDWKPTGQPDIRYEVDGQTVKRLTGPFHSPKPFGKTLCEYLDRLILGPPVLITPENQYLLSLGPTVHIELSDGGDQKMSMDGILTFTKKLKKGKR